MPGGPEDHFTDNCELYALVEGDEWAHVEALDPDADLPGLPACATGQLAGTRARTPCSSRRPFSGGTRRAAQAIARLRADTATTENEFEAVKARLLSDEASA